MAGAPGAADQADARDSHETTPDGRRSCASHPKRAHAASLSRRSLGVRLRPRGRAASEARMPNSNRPADVVMSIASVSD
jgi:hypothetical protein